MKNLKKLVSVVVALTMVISSMAFVSAKDFGDVDTSAAYAEAVDVLSDLAILNGDEAGNFNPDAEIKRSEFAAILCRALGQENSVSMGATQFTDVAAEHWASGYINWAAAAEIVNGKGNGIFDPDAPVKFEEAIKMIVVALGYEPMAAKKGGYPTGYQVAASSIGVTKGISFVGAANASRKDVARLVYNSLDVPLMDTSYYTFSDEDEYLIYNGKNGTERRTVLSYYLDIVKVKAEVKNTAKTAPSSLAKKDGKDLVELKLTNAFDFKWADILDGAYDNATARNSAKFLVGASDIADYMAMSVVAYIGVNEDDDYEVVSCVADAKSVSTLEVTEGIEVSAYTAAAPSASPAVEEGFTFEYYENEDDYKTTVVDIAPNATVYVNGKAAADSAFDRIKTYASKVVFMGAKGADYDKVFVTEYDFAVVDEVNVDDEYIKLVTGGTVDFSKDVRGDKFAYTITFDGAEIGLEDLQAGDLLNVICADDWKNDDDVVIDIVVTRDAVEGVVEEFDGTSKYVINGSEYEISAKNDSLVIEVNDAARYLLTIDGKLYAEDADYEVEGDAASVYGFVTKVGSETSFGETVYQVKMYTTEGAFVTYDLSKKVVVKNNGEKQDGEDAADVYAELATAVADVVAAKGDADSQGEFEAANATAKAAAIAKIADRLVTFKLNSSDEIKEIDLLTAGGSGANYNATTEKFLGKYFTAKSALIMAPVDVVGTEDIDASASENNANVYNVDEDDLALSAFSALDEDTEYNDSFLFDVNRKNEIGVAIVADAISTSHANAMAVVTKKSTIADGLIKLEVFQAGETASYVVAEDCTDFDSVAAGDIIQFNLGGDEIVKGDIVYDLSTTTLNSSLPTAITTGVKYAFNTADVVDVKSRYVVIDADGIEDPNVEADDTDVSFAKEQGTVALWNLDRSSSQLSKLSDLSSLKVSSRYTSNYIVYRTNDDGDIIDAIQYIAQ